MIKTRAWTARRTRHNANERTGSKKGTRRAEKIIPRDNSLRNSRKDEKLIGSQGLQARKTKYNLSGKENGHGPGKDSLREVITTVLREATRIVGGEVFAGNPERRHRSCPAECWCPREANSEDGRRWDTEGTSNLGNDTKRQDNAGQGGQRGV
ncbi:hypothetical protein B0H11DRAFT_2195297 [Mycena galericulata]|nr:hypothetical protein B0H11DRAFT_2195297 [Mycena galericulata]